MASPVQTKTPAPTQQLARAGMTVQNVNVATSLGGLVGLALGFLLPAWVVFGVMTDAGLALFVPFTIGPIIGVVLGQRTALWLMSR